MNRHQLIATAAAAVLFLLPFSGAAEEEQPTPILSASDQALAKLSAWNADDARKILEQNQESEGATASYVTASGLLKAEEGKLDEALKELDKAAKTGTSDPAPEYFQGQVLHWQRKYDDATKAWQRSHDRAKAALAADADDARARYYLGASLVRLKKYDQARKELDAAEKAGFDTAATRYQIGLSYTFEKSWQSAKDNFDAAIAADEMYAHAYYYRGRVWREMRRTDEMMLDMDRFLKLAPNAPESGIARSLLGAGGG